MLRQLQALSRSLSGSVKRTAAFTVYEGYSGNGRYWTTSGPTGRSAPLMAALAAGPLAIAVRYAVCGSSRQQLATADTLVTPDTVYKMYGVTQQQSCV